MKRITRFSLWFLLILVLALAGCAGGGGAADGDGPAGAENGDIGREGMTLITPENATEQVEMEIGQQAVLMLEPEYDWAVRTQPELVFSQVKDIELAEGEQGIYEAKFAGSATLQAIGKPICLKDNPPCTEPQKQYLIKVRVRTSSQ